VYREITGYGLRVMIEHCIRSGLGLGLGLAKDGVFKALGCVPLVYVRGSRTTRTST
jgi:hypothetical protein